MPWWNKALYDTCSLITLDKILLAHPELEHHFQGILTLATSCWAEQLRRDTAARLQPRVTCLEGPAAPDLARILATTCLPKALAQVDTLVFATAVHYGLTVVTGDQRLAQAVSRGGLPVGNVALILQTLVIRRVLSEAKCNALLAALVQRREYLLPPDLPQTWATLRHYTFLSPGRKSV